MTEYVYATWQGAMATALATVMHEREERMTTPTAPDLREALTAALEPMLSDPPEVTNPTFVPAVIAEILAVLEPALAAERERVVGLVRSCRPRQPLQPMPATMAAAAMKCDEIEELIRALPPSAAADPWQPIETAPKDGTQVDLWFKIWKRQPDCYWTEGRWTQRRERAGRFWTFQEEATHWMPVPPPPSAGDR